MLNFSLSHVTYSLYKLEFNLNFDNHIYLLPIKSDVFLSTNMGYLSNAVYIFFTGMKYINITIMKEKKMRLHVYTSIGDPSIGTLGTFI